MNDRQTRSAYRWLIYDIAKDRYWRGRDAIGGKGIWTDDPFRARWFTTQPTHVEVPPEGVTVRCKVELYRVGN